MKTNISEDLPARKFSPAASGGGESGSSGAAGPGGDIEKKARQLVYDAKYEVRKMMGKDTRMDPAAVTRAVLQRIDKSSSSQPVKMRARKIVMGDTQKRDVKEFASQTVAKALFDVFVNHSTNVIDEEELKKDLEEAIETQGEKKYKVRVTDKKTGNSYIRWATRPKITELRGNPNIESVEMLDLYGSPEPNQSERSKGAQTASVTAGKGMNNDGNLANNYPPYNKVTRGDVIAGATGKDQMGGKKKIKEEFIGEGDNDGGDKQLKPMSKGKKNKCKVYDGKGGDNMMGQGLMNHQELEGEVIAETGYSRFMNMVQEKMNLATADMGDVIADFETSDAPQFEGKTKKERQKMALAAKLEAEREAGMREEKECGYEDGEKKKEKKMDPREIPTRVNLVKNKLRAMGLKMSYEPEGEVIDEEMPKRAKGSRPSGTRTFTGMGYYGRKASEKKDPKSMRRIFPEPKEDKPLSDDENPPRKRRTREDDHPSLTARERN
jgi:hypothetical protein